MNSFEITKREVLVSVSIIAVLLIIGLMLSGKISQYHADSMEKYNKAVKLNSKDLFQYGMDTNAGYAFVEGELKAVDSVTYPEIGEQYMYIKKCKQRYTMHTKVVSHSDGKRTWTTTETYYTWDTVDTESLKCKEISFLGIVFDSSKIETPSAEYLETIKESSLVRYKYYGTEMNHAGTIFTTLKDKTINETKFYKNRTIQEVADSLDSDIGLVVFWVIWTILIFCCTFGFYYARNNWLE